MDSRYETTNARAWDSDSVVSVPASTRPASAALAPTNTAATSRPENSRPISLRTGANSGAQHHGPLLQQQIKNSRYPAGNQKGRNGSRSSAASASTEIITGFRPGYGPPNGRYTATNGRGAYQNGNGRGRGYVNGRPPNRGLSAKTAWAEPPRLVTNRRAAELASKRRKEEELKVFLKDPPRDMEGISDIGLYLWPSKSDHAEKYFGWRLVQLDPLRIANQVHIEDMMGTQYLRISCPSFHDNPEQSIAQTISSIRSAIEDARVKEMRARPVYIVVPPTASGMRSVVRPMKITREMVDIMARAFTTDHKPIMRVVFKAMDLKLVGQKLSENEKLEWTPKRDKIVQSNLKKFEEHLTENLMILAPVKGLMRMRVHFGHVAFKEYTKTFSGGKLSFEGFQEMVAVPWMETEFDPKIEDPNVALELRRTIMGWPERFRPVEAKTLTLREVEWKDTAIIFVKNEHGQRYRIEVDIDRICETDEGEYQLGCIRLFYDNLTNRRIRVESIDVEREVDYSLEVNSDNAVYEIPDNLLSLIKDSVSPKSPVREDAFELNYPHVSPRKIPGLEVFELSIRSVAQYMLSNSGYIVEIGIHRQWDGINTNREPESITSSVTMFHSNWDWNMRSIESITGAERGWSRDLSDFFEPDAGGANGFTGFLTEVRTIQSYLADAFRICRERAEEPLDLSSFDAETDTEEVPTPGTELNPEAEPFTPASGPSLALVTVETPAIASASESSFPLLDLS